MMVGKWSPCVREEIRDFFEKRKLINVNDAIKIVLNVLKCR